MFRRTVAPGVELKLLETSEAKALYNIADRNRERLRRWLPWVDQTRSPEDVRTFILRVVEQYHSNLGPQTGIWVDGALCGTIGCHPIDWSNRNSASAIGSTPRRKVKASSLVVAQSCSITFLTSSACIAPKSAVEPPTGGAVPSPNVSASRAKA